jgi:sugar phosphate isomerase/epimerase
MPTPLGPTDLVLCSGTVARDTPFRERVEAAAAAQFAAISLWGRDHAAARAEGWSDADMRTMLDDHGLSVAELDPAWWWLPGAADVHIAPEHDPFDVFRFGEDDLFALADTFGARSLNAVDVFGGDFTTEQAAESFAALCDRAAGHGLLVHLEFLPWSRIPDVRAAWDVVRLAGRDNGGIAVDSWHFFRGDPDFDALASVPGDRILGLQLDDGPAEPEADLMTATLHDRLLPGDGAFDLRRLTDTLRDTGTTTPMGVEVFSDELHALGAAAAARRAADATRALVGAPA